MIPLIRRVLGIAVVCLSVIFLSWALKESHSELSSLLTPGLMLLLAVLATVYVLLNQVLGSAWFSLVRSFDGPTLGWRSALTIFNTTQFFKYLPGNVFHMVGRYAKAREAGASHSALALAQAGELVTVLIAAGLVASVFSWPVLAELLRAYELTEWIPWVGLLGLVGFCGLITALVLGGRLHVGGKFLLACLQALPIYVAFILLSGAAAIPIALWIEPQLPIAPWGLVGILSTAWLIGFVLPGAPGGLGAREAVAVAGLTLVGVTLPVATAIAVGHRVVTLAGDGLTAIVGWLMALSARTHRIRGS